MLGVLGGCEEAKAGQAWGAGPVSWGTGLESLAPQSCHPAPCLQVTGTRTPPPPSLPPLGVQGPQGKTSPWQLSIICFEKTEKVFELDP